jgi:hypothetical protein
VEITRPGGPPGATTAEDLSFNDMAEIMSEVLGKEACFQQITFEAYKGQARSLRHVRRDSAGDDRLGLVKNEGLDGPRLDLRFRAR